MGETDAVPHLSVDAHRAALSRLVGPGRAVTVPLDRAACGRRLAADLVATDDLPRFDSSAMDGYALGPGDGPTWEVVDDVPAGSVPRVDLRPGVAARVMTGARMPVGAVCVVPVELTDAARTGPAPRSVTVSDVPRAGRHVRRAGEDVLAGDVLATVGAEVTPGLVALGRSAGCADVAVWASVRVTVVATGSELVDPTRTAGPGGIHESNSEMLAALAADGGCEVREVLTCDDDSDRLRALLDRLDASGEVDLVITTGGVSAGAFEVVRQVCEPLATFSFDHLAMQPGGPQGQGRWGGTPVVCLPGTPVGAFVGWRMLVLPAVDSRHGAPPRSCVEAVYEGPTRTFRPQTTQFVTAVHHADRGTVTVPDSRHLRALAAADCLVEVPPDVDRLEPGDAVAVHLLGRP